MLGVQALLTLNAISLGGNCAGADLGRSTVLFANERLRVLDFRLPAGAVANVSNTVPTVRWQIRGASDPIPAPSFYEAGTCATVASALEENRRDFVFEVLQPPRYTAAQVDALLRAPQQRSNMSVAVGSSMFLENEYVRMWDFHSPVGMDVFHQHVLDYAFVVIGNHSSLNLFHPSSAWPNGSQYDATFGFRDGHVSWEAIGNGGYEPGGTTPVMPGCLHSVDTRGFDEQFREYLIELK
jgi:hypothetical protein